MDGTENQKDSPRTPGQTSTEKQETSKDQAKTYSEDEVKKAVSDALSHAGREAKSLELREQSLSEREEVIKAKEAEADARELEEARRDPSKMRDYQAKQTQKQHQADLSAERAKLKREREELDRDKAEHAAAVKAAQETQREIGIWQIAEKYGLDAQMLKDLNLPIDRTETIAKAMSGGKPKELTEENKEEFTPDSNVTSGPKQSVEGKSSRQLFKEDFQDKQKKK